MKMIGKKGIAIVVIAILLFVLVLKFDVLSMETYGTGIPESTVNWMVTEQLKPVEEWQGNVEPGYTELIMDSGNDPIVTSYKDDPNVLSEQIAVQGTLTWKGGMFGWFMPQKGYYSIDYMSNINSGWNNIATGDFSGTTYVNTEYILIEGGLIGLHNYDTFFGGADDHQYIPAFTFKIKGQHVGALRIDVHSRFTRTFPYDQWDAVTSRDYVYLVSGEGHINIVGHTQYDVPMFEMDETVPIHVVCDYSGSTAQGEGNWELWCHPQASEHPLGNFRIASFSDMSDVVYNWNLPDGIWFRGMSDSKIKLKLRNTLFAQDEVMVNTIDLKANAPPTPTVSLDTYNPLVGDSVTVTGKCYTNEQTYEEIEKFMIRVIYTDNNQEIGYWTNIEAVGQDPSSYEKTFTVGRAGPIRIQVWAHDVAGRETVNPGIANIESHQGDHRWTIFVKSKGTSLPLQNVKVLLYPDESEKLTNSEGSVWYDIPSGYYQASIYKEGYRQETVNKQIDKDETTTVFIEQTAILWDLTVNVKDTDGNMIPYATIKVGAVSEAYSEADGSHTFSNLPEGDYVVQATKNEYSGSKDVHLDGNKEIDITITETGGPGELNFIKMVIALIIVAIFGVIGWFFPIPLPFGKPMNLVILLMVGVVIAVIFYLFVPI